MTAHDDRGKTDSPPVDLYTFISAAAHEIKSPVTAIRGYAQLLQRFAEEGSVPPDRLERGLTTIVTQADALLHLMDQLLEAACVASGRIELQCAALDARMVLAEVIEPFARDAGSHQVQGDLPSRPLIGHWDRDKVSHALRLLLSNAALYAHPGTTIFTGARRSAAQTGVAEFWVRDEGPGIAPDEQERIFECFVRGHTAGGGTRGLGLGLYVARALAEAHSGHLHVESQPGAGSTFYLCLPLA